MPFDGQRIWRTRRTGGGHGYHFWELKERSGPSILEVWVYQANGLLDGDVGVGFQSPGNVADASIEACGKAWFGWGPRSCITDAIVGGPHWPPVGSATSCDAVTRLGMLADTPHDHLDVSYKYGYLSAGT